MSQQSWYFAICVAAVLTCSALTTTDLARAQSCGDPNGNGDVDVIDASNARRAAVGLPSSCTLATCDMDANGTIDVIDASNMQRAAVGLPATVACSAGAIVDVKTTDGLPGLLSLGFAPVPEEDAPETIVAVQSLQVASVGRANPFTIFYDAEVQSPSETSEVNLIVAARGSTGPASNGFFEVPLGSTTGQVTLAVSFGQVLGAEEFLVDFATRPSGGAVGQYLSVPQAPDDAPICADFTIDAGETCDPPGSTCPGDFCDASCPIGFCDTECACIASQNPVPTPTIPPSACGNGVREGAEQCDGSDKLGCDGRPCLVNCRCAIPICGDGVREGAEQCDGPDNAACAGRLCLSGCVCAPLPTPTPAPTPTTVPSPTSITFLFTGAEQFWVVPANVTSIAADARGGQGGSGASQLPGGLGGRVQATLSVMPGTTVHVYVGGVGRNNSGTVGGAGGFNGGGQGGDNSPGSGGGGGGGASDVRMGGNALVNRVLVAAGGGGSSSSQGGGGGGVAGSRGADGESGAVGGAGGTQTSGGGGGCFGGQAGCSMCGANGVFAQGGDGGDCFNGGGGGGGGGGHYGGGGGSGTSGLGGGGGGGSSLVPAGGSSTTGFQAGSGRVTITY